MKPISRKIIGVAFIVVPIAILLATGIAIAGVKTVSLALLYTGIILILAGFIAKGIDLVSN